MSDALPQILADVSILRLAFATYVARTIPSTGNVTQIVKEHATIFDMRFHTTLSEFSQLIVPHRLMYQIFYCFDH